MRKEYEESKNNPLDAPVPGQSLTDKPGNYPWEHPPLYELIGRFGFEVFNIAAG